MRIFARVFLIGALAVAPGSALAADANGNFSIRGAGTVACGKYLQASPAQKQFAETWWAGYLTAMNRSTPNTYDVIGAWTVTQANNWLMAYCQNNPGHRLATAVHKMLEAAYPTRKVSGGE